LNLVLLWGKSMTTAEGVRQEGVPLSERERRIWADIEWAEHDSEVLGDYAGQWIAIYNQKVVAWGADREEVLRQGVQAAQQPPEELAIWPVLSDIALTSDHPAGCP
jgi:hypothetical protein